MSATGETVFRRPASPAPAVGIPAERLESLWLRAAFALALFVLYFVYRNRVPFGDSVVYADTIASGDFFVRSVHVGYYWIGWVAYRIGGWFGLPVDQSLALLGAVTTPLAVLLCYRFARIVLGDPIRAWLATLAFAFSGRVLVQGLEGEVYSTQLVLLLGGYLAFHAGRARWTGILMAIAMLVSPLTVMGAAPFVWMAARRREWKPLVMAMVVAAVPYLIVLAICWRDYFFGVRGLLHHGSGHAPSWETLFYHGYALLKNLHWMTPFALLGLWSWIRSRNSLAGVLLATLALHLPILLRAREEGMLLISGYPVLALAIAEGLNLLLRGGAKGAAPAALAPARVATVAVLLALYAGTAFFVWFHPPTERYRDSVVRFLASCPPRSIVIAQWQHALALDYLGREMEAEGRPRAHTVIADYLTRDHLRSVLDGTAPVYVFEKYVPTRLARLMPSENLVSHRAERSLVTSLREKAPEIATEPVVEQVGGPIILRVVASR